MIPEEFVDLRNSILASIEPLEDIIRRARELAESSPPPENRRPATEADIIVGAIIWHWRSEEHGGWYWHEIKEVHYPSDDFKAYMADDGCKYGLHNAWVKT